MPGIFYKHLVGILGNQVNKRVYINEPEETTPGLFA